MHTSEFITMMIMGIGKFYSDRREIALNNLIHNQRETLDINLLKDLRLHTPTHVGKHP
jgi:hypothetical protein